MNETEKLNVRIALYSNYSGEMRVPHWTKTSSAMCNKIVKLYKELGYHPEDIVDIKIQLDGKYGESIEVIKTLGEIKQVIKNIYKLEAKRAINKGE